ncbi:aldo/keto reductase [Patescibacteria group bacterium]|nr:aldo/keto reductase [Patescibacteria group bacterium]
MKFRILGRTNLRVSEIGFGAIPIQRVSFKEAADIINKAHQCGINFIDTARAWTDSELKVGKIIKSCRSEWIIASKSPVLTFKEMKEEITQSLKNLQTDFIELYMIHHLKDKKMLDLVLSQNGALKALKEAQKEGKIKFIGVSGHNLETLLLVAKTGLFDVLMVNFNFKEQEATKVLLPFCQKENIGVIVMKPLAGGTFKNAAAAIRFCLINPTISTVIPGILNERELNEDVVEVLKNPNFTKEDKEKLKKEVKKIGLPFCRACGYCITRDGGCPARINITLCLRLEGYFEKFGPKDWLMEVYNKTPVKPASCLFCGHCEKVCPFSLPIIRALRNLKIRKAAEKKWGKEKPSINIPARDYNDEYQEFVNLTQKILGEDHDIPLAYFNFPKPANEGQKTTVRNLFKEMVKRVHPDEKRMKEILKRLCQEMGIESEGIKNFENLLTLADYDNVVDLMRVLPRIKDN